MTKIDNALKDVRIHRVVLGDMKLEEGQEAPSRSRSKCIDETSTEGERTDETRAHGSDEHPLPEVVVAGALKLGVEQLRTIRHRNLVVDNFSVNFVHLV